jgi:glucose-1-phosphate cytidylyltransferase
VDTGEDTLTGGRLKRVKDYLKDEESFCFTYGDGLADVNVAELVKFHKNQGKLATVTAVQPPGRYGALDIKNHQVSQFIEKPKGDGGWINGGFFVLSPKCIDYIENDQSSWEGLPLVTIAKQGELAAYEHSGFWQPMDTLREKNLLEDLWASGKAPWKAW